MYRARTRGTRDESPTLFMNPKAYERAFRQAKGRHERASFAAMPSLASALTAM
jgi:hypothetical protein